MQKHRIDINSDLVERLVKIANAGAFGQKGRELVENKNVDAIVEQVIAFYINFTNYEKVTTSAS